MVDVSNYVSLHQHPVLLIARYESTPNVAVFIFEEGLNRTLLHLLNWISCESFRDYN